MKKTTKNKFILGLSVFGASVIVGGGLAVENTAVVEADTAPIHANLQNLGASVNLDEPQVRFEFDLKETGTHVALAEGATAGVCVIPADLLGEGEELTKDTDKVSMATMKWSGENGYAYLPKDSIPAGQYNRRLAFRGYVEENGAYTYTDTAYASMAYVAYKNYAAYESDPDKKAMLDEYRGNYTLTYAGGSITDLCYGATFTLPTTIDETEVDSWYWDEAMTDDIAADDYATGSMAIYYKVKTYNVSGNVKLDGNGVAADIYVGEDKVGTAGTDGAYSLENIAGNSVLTFTYKNDGKTYRGESAKVTSAGALSDVTLTDVTYEIASYGGYYSGASMVTATNTATGVTTVTGADYLLMMPNTATSKNYTFGVTTSSTYTKETEETAGIAIGTKTAEGKTVILSVTVRRFGQVCICLRESGGEDALTWYADPSGQGFHGTNVSIERTSDSFIVKANSNTTVERKLVISKDGTITANRIDNGTTVTAMPYTYGASELSATGKARIAEFFEDGVEHVIGLSGYGANGVSSTRVYTVSYAVKEVVTLSGKITLPAGVNASDIVIESDYENESWTNAVDANGNFTVSALKGCTALRFSTAGYTGYALDLNDLTNVTMTDNKYEISTSTFAERADSLDGTVSVFAGTSAGAYTYLMPNTATTGSYKFTVKIKHETANANATNGGIVLTDGTNTFKFVARNDSGAWKNGMMIRVYCNGTQSFIGEGYETGSWSTTVSDSSYINYSIERTATSISVYAINSSGTKNGFTIAADGSVTFTRANFYAGGSVSADVKSKFAALVTANTHTLGFATGEADSKNASMTIKYQVTEFTVNQ